MFFGRNEGKVTRAAETHLARETRKITPPKTRVYEKVGIANSAISQPISFQSQLVTIVPYDCVSHKGTTVFPSIPVPNSGTSVPPHEFHLPLSAVTVHEQDMVEKISHLAYMHMMKYIRCIVRLNKSEVICY